MKKITLSPFGSFQKSFYNKAFIYEIDNRWYLKSYNTIVAYIDNNGDFFRTWQGWSATTAKHVHSFRLQYGLNTISKKDWLSMPVKDVPFSIRYIRSDI